MFCEFCSLNLSNINPFYINILIQKAIAKCPILSTPYISEYANRLWQAVLNSLQSPRDRTPPILGRITIATREWLGWWLRTFVIRRLIARRQSIVDELTCARLNDSGRAEECFEYHTFRYWSAILRDCDRSKKLCRFMINGYDLVLLELILQVLWYKKEGIQCTNLGSRNTI